MPTFADLSINERHELWAVLSLRHAKGIGARRAWRLVRLFGSALEAARAGLKDAAAWRGASIPSHLAEGYAAEGWRAGAGREWAVIKASGVNVLLHASPDYPPSLRELDDAPLLLYWRGNLGLLRGPAVAVVGARKCTREGLAASALIARDLGRAGVAVISGMARGVDRAAHLAALDGPGRSVGVLGAGLDVAYPQCNADLFELMKAKGLLLSEYAPGTIPEAGNFPVRNRLISGLAQGVLVVEAAGRSGSLITARLALEQGRDVFAVPVSPLSSFSEGCKNLIRSGAKTVFHADDILAELAPQLSREAQLALEARFQEAAQRRKADKADKADKANKADKADKAALPDGNDAAELLRTPPQSGLPWQPANKGRAGGSEAVSSGPKGGVDAVEDGPGLCAAAPAPAVENTAPGKGGKDCPEPVLSRDEARLLGFLRGQSLHIDALAGLAAMDVAALSGLLTLMEVRGLVSRRPGMYYCLPGW